MRTLLVPAVLAVALVAPALPLASADHIGPCWHEYIDAAIQGAKDPKHAVGIMVATVKACANPGFLCEILDPCVLP